MPGNFATTTRFALRRLLGTSKVSDVDEGFQALAEDVDTKMAGYSEGTLAARPAAGVPNRIYRVSSGAGQIGLFHDTGTIYESILALAEASAYEAAVTRTSGSAFTPNATRPVALAFTVTKGGSGGTMETQVNVGGKIVFTDMRFAGDSGVTTAVNASVSGFVLVPPNSAVTISVTSTGATALSITTKQLVL